MTKGFFLFSHIHFADDWSLLLSTAFPSPFLIAKFCRNPCSDKNMQGRTSTKSTIKNHKSKIAPSKNFSCYLLTNKEFCLLQHLHGLASTTVEHPSPIS